MGPEDVLRNKIKLHLEKNLPPGDVEEVHGPLEYGIDLIYRREDIFGAKRHFGLQIKAKDITCKRGKLTADIKEIIGQITVAFGCKFANFINENSDGILLDGIYIVTDGIIDPAAKKYIVAAHIGFRQIYFLEGKDITSILTLAEADEDILKEK